MYKDSTTKRKRSNSTGEKAEPTSRRKRSMSMIAKVVTALGPKSPSIPTQAQLDAAKPAEEGVYHGNLFKVSYDSYDGVWLCCNGRCRNENCVKHYKGVHPFKYLTCDRCDHILCSECSSSEILAPICLIDMEPFEKRFHTPARQVRYCQLCRACGLTCRGAFKHGRLKFPSTCPCGKSIVEKDSCLHFFIGSNEEYQHDPQGVTVNVRLDGRLAALDRVTKERRSDSSEDNPTASLQLRPTNVLQATDKEPRESTKNRRYDTRTRPVKIRTHSFVTNPDMGQPEDGPHPAMVRPSADRQNTAPSV